MYALRNSGSGELEKRNDKTLFIIHTYIAQVSFITSFSSVNITLIIKFHEVIKIKMYK